MSYNESTNGTGSAIAASNRDEHGRYQPGHALPGPGRKPRSVEAAYLAAIKDSLPPEEVEAIIREALQLARDTRSWRGLLEVVSFAVSYGAGKPQQKVVTQDGNLDLLLAALADDTPLLPAPAQP